MAACEEPLLPQPAPAVLDSSSRMMQRAVRFMAVCLAMMCVVCMLLLLLDWYTQQPACSSSTLFWGAAPLAHLCAPLPQSWTLSAARICLTILDLAGIVLAVQVWQLDSLGPPLAHSSDTSSKEDEVEDDCCPAHGDDDEAGCDCGAEDPPWLTQQALTVPLSVWLALLAAASFAVTFWV